MATIRSIVTDARRSLTTFELQSLQQLLESYRTVWNSIAIQLTEVQERIAAAQAAGITVNDAWLRRQVWWTSMLSSIDAELKRFERQAVQMVLADQQFGLTTALDASASIQRDLVARGINIAGATKAAVDFASLEELMNVLQPSSPVRQAIDRYGSRISDRIVARLIEGTGTGLGPTTITNNIVRDVGPEAMRARFHTITRTETMRAYRSAFTKALAPDFEEGILVGYRWIAGLSSRTCPACLARHNQIYPYDPGGYHVGCRCVLVPVINPRYAPPSPPGISGDEWLRSQPEHIRRKVLGTGDRFNAFEDGWSLNSFAGEVTDKVWGKQIITLPMSRSSRSI